MTTIPNRMKGGFVRVPDAWIYLPISPQAKMLLVAFCAHADEGGRSWCSYEQLSEIVQRCKGSISGYVRELREAGLIDCKKQRYGNGFNYRLLITLVGWRDLLAHWASLRHAQKVCNDEARSVPDEADRSPEPKPASQVDPGDAIARTATDGTSSSRSATFSAQNLERRVQQADRMDPEGPINQIHKTQTREVVLSNEDEAAWRRFRPCDRDPLDAVYGNPDPALLRKVIDAAEAARARIDLFSTSEARSRCRDALEAFVARRRLDADSKEIALAADALAGVAKSPGAVDASVAALDAAWEPHWRRLSTPQQIVECCRTAAEGSLPPLEDRQEAGRLQNRVWLARLHLSKQTGAGVRGQRAAIPERPKAAK